MDFLFIPCIPQAFKQSYQFATECLPSLAASGFLCAAGFLLHAAVRLFFTAGGLFRTSFLLLAASGFLHATVSLLLAASFLLQAALGLFSAARLLLAASFLLQAALGLFSAARFLQLAAALGGFSFFGDSRNAQQQDGDGYNGHELLHVFSS